MALNAQQALFHLHVDDGRRQALEQRPQHLPGKVCVLQRAAERLAPGRVAEFILGKRVGSLGQQGIDQDGVAGTRRQHQGRGTDGGQMVHAIGLALPQDVLEILRLVGLQMPLPQDCNRPQVHALTL